MVGRPDWCRVDVGADAVPYAVALLAARVESMRLQMRRAYWTELASGHDGWLIVGPDDLEGVTVFVGAAVVRVDHWPGEPVLVVSTGRTVADAYHAARQFELHGLPADTIRAFGPPGWEHVSLPLTRARNRRVDFVPDRKMPGPMIGVELT
jgi:hypothetical protein